MTTGNGGKTTATWIAILISAVGGAATLSYALTKATLDKTDERLDKIEAAVAKIDDKIETKMGQFKSELSFRVDKANDEHKQYDIRLDRLETRTGLR